ncbi:centrosomal protein of 135 kDa-like isoform X2 [Phyllopteryx taeniolatus]|uniref:centrosomal protein of 135 kDa-like isoform X2 n=1 Tax=Phyllopteryx taeniolatus TaxID=161469 RepID=UPI002AD519DC|nr:centrosomal protein of 135 kDa-like isoform X2 [Phyllopteryx taeniolatus]
MTCKGLFTMRILELLPLVSMCDNLVIRESRFPGCLSIFQCLWQMSTMAVNKERKRSKLRGHLHMMGYNHYLGAESVPLVEKLFSDLVHTTESLNESQRSTDKSEKESQNCDVRLTRENQKLHLELMMVKGEKAHVTKELKVYITKLDDELALLKSLNKRYVQKIHSLEKDCKEKARIIRQLRRKNLNVGVQAEALHATSLSDEPHAAGLQQEELTKSKTELENSQEHIRLLNNQIDELQETNVTLEQKVKGVGHKSSTKVADLTSKNHELCQEITDIRNLARMMEMEKRQKLKTAEMKLQDLKDVNRKQQEVIKNLEDQLSKKRMTSDLPGEHEQKPRTVDHQDDIHVEASDLEFIKSELEDQLGDLREQDENFKGMVDLLAAEKSRLQDKVQKMMSVEKVLVLELEGWRTRYGICGRARSPSRLDAFVKSLEEERDHYRQEAEHYKNVSMSSSSSRSPDRQRSQGIEKIKQQPEDQSSNPPDEICNLKEALRLVEENLHQVTKEKISLMEELNEMQKAQQSSNTPPGILKPNEKFMQAAKKIQQLTKEKDGQIEEIEHERRNSNTSDEISNLPSEENLQQQLQPERHDSTVFAEIVDLKEELSLAEEKTQLLTAEKDSLMEEFQQKQLQCEQHTSEMSNLRERLKLAEEKIQQLMGEKHAQMEELKQMQEQHAAPSAEITKLKEELRLAKERISQVSTAKNPLMEELKQQHEKQISNASAEISKLKEELQRAEEKIQQLTSEKDSLMEEFKQKQLQHEEHDSKISAEMFTLKEKLKNAEEKIQQEKSEKGIKMEELKKMQIQLDNDSLSTSDEIANLKEQHRLAEEQILLMMDEKQSLMQELKQQKLQHEQHISNTCAEISDLKEKLGVAEEKIQQVTAEKDKQMKEFKQKQLQDEEHNSKQSAELLTLKEKITKTEEKLQQVKSEKDTQMEELKQIQLKHDEQHSKTSAEILTLDEKLRLAEEQIQQVKAEKDSLTEELELQQSADQNSNTSAEVVELKEKLRVAEEKIQELTAVKDSLVEELKQMQQQNEQLTSSTSAEISKLKESLRLAEEKIQQVTEEKDSQLEELELQPVDESSKHPSDEVLELKDKLRWAEEKVQLVTSEKDSLMEELKKQQKTSSSTADEISKLKEKLRLAEENIQQLTEEKDSLMEELKKNNSSITCDEISNLKEKLRLAEENIQQLTKEKDSKDVEQKQRDDQSANAAAEVVKLKEKLRRAEDKIQQLTKEKDSKEVEKQRDDQSANAAAEVVKLKEKLRRAEDKIQQLTKEKDSKEVEQKQRDDQSANAAAEVVKLKEKLRRAEDKIQQLTKEKASKEVEQKQCDDQSANANAEVVKLKEELKWTEDKIQQVTVEKDSLIKELKRKASSNTSEELSNLKEKLRLAEEKIHQVTAEKDSLMEELKQKTSSNTSEEISKLKKKLGLAEEKIQQQIRGDPSSNTSAEALNMLRDNLKLADEKIQRVTAEKDSLREELKGGQTSPLPYGHGHENRILDLQNVIHSLEQENLELRSQVFALRDRERDVERQMDARSAALVQNAEEAARQRKAGSGLRRQQEQIQNALLDLQQMLSVKNNELHAAHSQMEKLEDIIESLSQQLYQHKQEAEVLRISFSALCIKKDVMQEEMAKKTKRLEVLQEQLGKKLEVELKSRERELAAQRILQNHQEGLLQLKRDNELIIDEYRRLQDDLAAMTQENQAAHVEMEETLCERDELKQRVHSYINTVSRIENILKMKDQENLELAERFRMARSDMQEREHRLQHVEGLIGSVRLELLSSEKERQHLREALGRKEREIQQHLQDFQTYKEQAATFARGMSQLEEELRVLQEEKVSLLADLVSVRELCVKMDSDKEIAARQLLHKSMELERASTRHEDALTEAALLREHLASEKLALRNTDAMLATSRLEMFQAHQAASDKDAELKALRHRLTLAENKIVAHAREVTNLRGKVTQLQTKMEVLSSKGHERGALRDPPSYDISFRPLRASSPVDHPAIPRQMAPDSSIQEEFTLGPT